MRSKRKDYLIIGATAIIVVTVSILLFYPSLIGGFSKSYVDLVHKKDLTEESNIVLQTNEANILQKQNEFLTLEDQERMMSLQASELKMKINEDDFDLDIPSFLISIEQEALKNKLDLYIAFSQIKTSTGGMIPATSPIDGNTTVENDDTAVEDPNVIQVDPQNSPQNTQEDNREENEDSNDEPFSNEEIQNGSMTIEGFDSTIIPIEILGSYKNVRNYIKYLDGIGLIKPSSVVMSYDGDEKLVEAKIILNIFHEEVMR